MWEWENGLNLGMDVMDVMDGMDGMDWKDAGPDSLEWSISSISYIRP